MKNTRNEIECCNCERAQMVEQLVEIVGERHGEEYPVSVSGLHCPSCNYSTIDSSQSEAFAQAVSDAYRKAHGLLTGTEISQRRKRLALTQAQFAQFLSVGVASVKRWEAGQIQEPSMDQLMRLKTDAIERPLFDRQVYSPNLVRWNRTAVNDPNRICEGIYLEETAA